MKEKIKIIIIFAIMIMLSYVVFEFVRYQNRMDSASGFSISSYNDCIEECNHSVKELTKNYKIEATVNFKNSVCSQICNRNKKGD
jgi:hypothetical protein